MHTVVLNLRILRKLELNNSIYFAEKRLSMKALDLHNMYGSKNLNPFFSYDNRLL